MFPPSGLGCFQGHSPPLLGCHGLQTAFAADLSPTTAHSGHDAGYVGGGYFRFWGVRPGGAADHLVGGLVYVRLCYAGRSGT